MSQIHAFINSVKQFKLYMCFYNNLLAFINVFLSLLFQASVFSDDTKTMSDKNDHLHGWSVYWEYFKLGGGTFGMAVMVLLCILVQVNICQFHQFDSFSWKFLDNWTLLILSCHMFCLIGGYTGGKWQYSQLSCNGDLSVLWDQYLIPFISVLCAWSSTMQWPLHLSYLLLQCLFISGHTNTLDLVTTVQFSSMKPSHLLPIKHQMKFLTACFGIFGISAVMTMCDYVSTSDFLSSSLHLPSFERQPSVLLQWELVVNSTSKFFEACFEPLSASLKAKKLVNEFSSLHE